MGDGIKIVTQKAEQAEIERAQTCTPRKPDFSKQGDQGEYCCPFDGTQYKLDADGPAFYWNQVNKGGQPDAGNKSVKLANGSMCQRWEVKK
jgi:hypothetical protein